VPGASWLEWLTLGVAVRGLVTWQQRSRDERAGNCYEVAFWFFIESGIPAAGSKLVHGFPVYQQPGKDYGKLFGHAWVEAQHPVIGTLCLNTIDLVWVPAPTFYRLGRIDAGLCHLYTKAQALQMVVEHETYGPWENGPPGAL